MTVKTLTYNELQITSADIFDQMGYHGTLPDQATRLETQAVVDDVRQWLRPRFCYVIVSQLPAFDMGKIILRQLQGSEAYACFIATSGVEYEAYLNRLKLQGDLVPLYIADALGSVIAEKCADRMEEHLQLSIDKLGWHHTNRFSPGYCGWSVSEQQLLFPLFNGNTCGVRLTDSSLMLPIKSVSGIIGVGKDVHKLDYTCRLCNQANCFRRHRESGRTELSGSSDKPE